VAGRHDGIVQKRIVFIQQIVTAAHDAEKPGKDGTLSYAIDRQSAQIALLPVEGIHQAAGIGQLRHHMLLARGEFGAPIGHRDRLPARGALRLVVEGTPVGVAPGRGLAGSRQKDREG